jgi:hypothetical protein
LSFIKLSAPDKIIIRAKKMALSTRQKQIINRLHEVNGVLSSADITA